MPDLAAWRIEQGMIDRLFADVLTAEHLRPLLKSLSAGSSPLTTEATAWSIRTDGLLEGYRQRLRAVLLGEDVQQARRILDYFVAKVVVSGESGLLYYTFPLKEANTVHRAALRL